MKRVRIISEPPVGTTVLVCGRNEDNTLEHLGDITLIEDGSAVVMNEWGNGLQFFDTHEDAVDYVESRMCENPVYAMI